MGPWAVLQGFNIAQVPSALIIRQGLPPPKNGIYKKLCIPTCSNCSHLQSTLHLVHCTYQDVSPLLKTGFAQDLTSLLFSPQMVRDAHDISQDQQAEPEEEAESGASHATGGFARWLPRGEAGEK